MKKAQFLKKLAFVVAIALPLTSCNLTVNDSIKGSGNIVTQTRNITEDFKKIEVSEGIEVSVEQSQDKIVTVAADDNLQQHIITKVENGVLIIETDHGYNTAQAPKITVRMPVINGLDTSSSAHISSTNTIRTDEMEVNSGSGSGIEISVEADHITLEASSDGNIQVSGKALTLETSASSGGEINAQRLMANDVSAQASSGGSTSVSPILSLDAKASSGGSISYHKIPKGNLSKEESSGGSISER